MGGFSHSFILQSPEATAAWAQSLSGVLGAGDVLLLHGDVGAGKTHFARALIQSRLRAAGRHEDVPSPTYTLVQTYWDGLIEIWHADLYRLSDVTEVYELGLGDAFRDAICLIEWPDRLADMKPDHCLDITLAQTKNPNSRKVTVSGDPAHWRHILASLKAGGYV